MYSDGARLPTESELVAQHGLSRQTVRRAFQDLVAEGAVYRVPGRGTYAHDGSHRYLRQLGSIEDLMSLSDDTTMEVISGLRRRVDVDAASGCVSTTTSSTRSSSAGCTDPIPVCRSC